jgi:hypothetical protein
MNIERTMEFILNAQAKAEARMDKADKRIDGITKLLQQGMRILVKTADSIAESQKRNDARFAALTQSVAGLVEGQKGLNRVVVELKESQKRTDVKMAELAEAQKETQKSLKAFLNSFRHRRNGR